MDQTADTAWCPLELSLMVSNSIACVTFQEIFRDACGSHSPRVGTQAAPEGWRKNCLYDPIQPILPGKRVIDQSGAI